VDRLDAIWQKLDLILDFEVKNAQSDTPDQILFQKLINFSPFSCHICTECGQNEGSFAEIGFDSPF